MRKKLLIWALALGLLFAGFTRWLTINPIQQTDRSVMETIQTLIPKTWDAGLSLISIVGSFEFVAVGLVIILAWRRKISGLLVLIAFGAGHILEVSGKFIINHPTPGAEFYRYHIPFWWPSGEIQSGSSYPSGHSMRAVFMAVLITSLLLNNPKISKRNKIIIIAGAVLVLAIVLISRISLGEHWLSDVIGGAILGASLGLVAVSY